MMINKSISFSMILGCAFLVLAAMFSSCASRKPVMVTPDKSFSTIEWTSEELAQDIAIHTLTVTPEASYHLIRLNRSEKPHVHDTHDLVIVITQGKMRFHWKDRSLDLAPGDVIEIPRGTVHWGEKVTSESPEIYAVVTPPFDGKDQREV